MKGQIVVSTSASGAQVRSFISEKESIFLQIKERANICENRAEVFRTNFDQLAIAFTKDSQSFFENRPIPSTQMSANLLTTQQMSVSIIKLLNVCKLLTNSHFRRSKK